QRKLGEAWAAVEHLQIAVEQLLEAHAPARRRNAADVHAGERPIENKRLKLPEIVDVRIERRGARLESGRNPSEAHAFRPFACEELECRRHDGVAAEPGLYTSPSSSASDLWRIERVSRAHPRTVWAASRVRQGCLVLPSPSGSAGEPSTNSVR